MLPNDQHIVEARERVGAGEAYPALVDGTPATVVQFVDGNLQTAVPPVTFDTYTIGSYADIRLTSPPVTLESAGMDCAWMQTNQTFQNVNTLEPMNTCLSKQN